MLFRSADDAALRGQMGAAARSEARRRFGNAAFRGQVRKLYRLAEFSATEEASALGYTNT